MCHFKDQIILSENDVAQISRCKCCKMYTLIYKNSCVSFYKHEFKNFCNMLRGLSSEDFGQYIVNREQVLIRNRKEQIGLCLQKDEVKQILSMYDEAMAIDEVFSIIYTH